MPLSMFNDSQPQYLYLVVLLFPFHQNSHFTNYDDNDNDGGLNSSQIFDRRHFKMIYSDLVHFTYRKR